MLPVALIRLLALSVLTCLAFLLTGCVTAADGSRKFNPWEAAKKADGGIEDWLDRRRGFDTSRPGMWE